MDNHGKNKIGLTIAFLWLIGMGIWAICDPSAAESWISEGRRSGLKALIIDAWGRPLGITVVVLGAFAILGLHFTPAGDDVSNY